MITFDKLHIKNFMSVGNVTQTVDLSGNGLNLILGNNLDTGGDSNSNGSGKTTIINALNYVLFDKSLGDIKKDNLINKTNSKNMSVTVNFKVNENNFKITRGRKPGVLNFIVNGVNKEQGENRLTQVEIEKILKIDQLMFNNIVTLNTTTDSFFKIKSSEKQYFIEKLLGITILSEKAEILKDQMKNNKTEIKIEESKIDLIKKSNEKITNKINDIKNKKNTWDKNNKIKIQNIKKSLTELLELNIDNEIENFKQLDIYNNNKTLSKQLNNDLNSIKKIFDKDSNSLLKLYDELDLLEKKTCHTCGQSLNENHKDILNKKLSEIKTLEEDIVINDNKIKNLNKKIIKIPTSLKKPITYYKNLNDVYDHKNSINKLEHELNTHENSINPYIDQINILNDESIQNISWDNINHYKKLLTHQSFIYELLNNNNSIVRREIIRNNLILLNKKLASYLQTLGLQHIIYFSDDLSICIKLFDQDLDFYNLSNGEQTRAKIGLSLAFRFVYESLHDNYNILFVDEMADTGIDTNGADSILKILKNMRSKKIFLISHKSELIENRVGNVIQVEKENGFTTIKQ